MKTRTPGVGEIERRMTINRRRDWYESCAMIHGPEERKKNARKSACDCAKAQLFIIYKPTSFEEPVSETRRRYCFRGCGCTAAGRSGCSAGTAKKSSHPWHFRCWSLRRNELECTDLLHWTGIAPFFVTWCTYRRWFCVAKALGQWFYPRSRKRNHVQTLATGVPKLKTWLGTQRVKRINLPACMPSLPQRKGFNVLLEEV